MPQSLICEFAEPIPDPLRDQFFQRVKKLLSADAIVSPAKIIEVCQRVQIELRIAPPTAEPPTMRPTRSQPAKGPFRGRG